MQNAIAILITGMGLGSRYNSQRYLQYHIIKTENRCKTDAKYNCNFNCRDGPGKLQNLSENPPLEASACQEDQLKVILLRMSMIVMVMMMRRMIVMSMRMRRKTAMMMKIFCSWQVNLRWKR